MNIIQLLKYEDRIKKMVFVCLIISTTVLFYAPPAASARRVKGKAMTEHSVRLLVEIEPQGWFIERIRNKKEDIPRLIELPLREAVETLYDKNILTIRSSADRNDIQYGFAYIEGELNSLSEENGRELRRMVNEGIAEIEGVYFRLKVKVNTQTTVEIVRDSFINIARRFYYQPPIWIERERFTWESFKERYLISEDKDVLPFVEKMGYYYDARRGFI
ncbi:MAG: hypothetical protein NC818_05630 [Candidatus Omnitrophica bacterium]|nr:hypothetical protein [Candidatus Omnitrophota bacterium]